MPSEQDQSAPASEFVFADGVGRIGFIASVSQPFCMNCNRFRLTADGKLRNCLFSLEETDIRRILRGGGTDDEIAKRGPQLDRRQERGARDQHGPLHPAAAAHVFDRRLMFEKPEWPETKLE